MSKRIRWSIILAVIALLCATGSVFAFYFFQSNRIGGNENSLQDPSGDSSWVVTVNSAADLWRYGTDAKFNSSDEVSSAGVRKILKFGKDIKLDEDVTLTNDVNLDLSAFTLNLAGHTLTLRNSYMGSLNISGTKPADGESVVSNLSDGTSAPGGKIVVELPRGILEATSLTTDYAVYFEKISVSNLDSTARQKLAERIFAFTAHMTEGDYIGDLDLVTNYLCYDVRFDYAPNPYFDALGRFLPDELPAVSDGSSEVGIAVKYRLTLTFPDVGNEIHQRNLNLTVVSRDVLATCEKLAQKMLDEYLAPYGGKLERNIQLPLKNGYFGYTVRYECYLDGSLSPDSSLIGASGVLRRPDRGNTLTLRAYAVKGGTETKIKDYVFAVESSSNYQTARDAMEKQDADKKFNVSPFIFDEKNVTSMTFRGMSELSASGVNQIVYSVEGADGTPVDDYVFVLSRDADGNPLTTGTVFDTENMGAAIPVLTINGTLPDVNKEIYLKAAFFFKDGTPQNVVLKYRIYRAVGDESGDAGEGAYQLQYNEILKQFREQTNGGKTYRSFEMPKKLLGVYVYYHIDALPKGLDWKESAAEQFPIDPDKLDLENRQVTVFIKFLSVPGTVNWAEVTRKYTFTLYGVVTPEVMPNPALRRSVLAAVNQKYGDTDTAIITERIRTIESLTIADLAAEADFSEGYKGLGVFSALRNLTVTNGFFGKNPEDFRSLPSSTLKVLNLTGNGFGTASPDPNEFGKLLGGLDGFAALETLVLDGNLIRNYDSFPLLPSLKTLQARACGTSDVSGLTLLSALASLNLSNPEGTGAAMKNSVFDYSPLLKIENLARLDCYSESDGAGDWSLQFTTFVMLTERGTAVYNGYNGSAPTPEEKPVLFKMPSDSAILEAVWALEGIFHFMSSDAVFTGGVLTGTFQVPAKLGAAYDPVWDFSAFGSESQYTVSTSNGISTVTHHRGAGVYRIVASIRVTVTESGVSKDVTVSKAYAVIVTERGTV